MPSFFLEKLYNLVDENLYLSCPVLSGNMRHHIDVNTVLKEDEEVEIVISAPFYDLKEFTKNHKIVYTGKIIDGKHDYAYWVNAVGAFGRGGRNVNWVHRAIYEAVTTFASEIDAQVINELPLSSS